MPIDCPKCQRPNGDHRTTCMYCGENLPDPSPEQKAAAFTPKLVPQAGAEKFFFVLLPSFEEVGYSPDLLGKSVVDMLCNWFNTDPYYLTQWLKTKAPRILKTYTDRSESQSIVPEMEKMGFRTLSVASEDLNRMGYSFRAYSAQLDQDFIFMDREKKVYKVNPEDIFLLVRGKIKVQKAERGKKNSGKGDKSQPSFSVDDLDQSDYFVFDVFSKNPQMPPLRVKSSQFDFACLGNNAVSSSFINFGQLIRELQEHCPLMKIDDTFGHINPVLTDHKTAGMFDPTVSHISSYRAGAGPQNNEPQFGQFSRIICYLHQQGIQGFGR